MFKEIIIFPLFHQWVLTLSNKGPMIYIAHLTVLINNTFAKSYDYIKTLIMRGKRRFLLFFGFVLSLSSQSKCFYSYGEVTITGEGLQILTYARHLWPLSSEVFFLACHTYCDTWHPFIWSSPKTRDTHTYYLSFLRMEWSLFV